MKKSSISASALPHCHSGSERMRVFLVIIIIFIFLTSGLDENPLLTDEEHALYPWYSGCPNTSSFFVFKFRLRMPFASPPQQHNTCVRLREATLDDAGEEADGIRWRNLKTKTKKELMFGHPEYHGYSACSSSVSKGF